MRVFPLEPALIERGGCRLKRIAAARHAEDDDDRSVHVFNVMKNVDRTEKTMISLG